MLGPVRCQKFADWRIHDFLGFSKSDFGRPSPMPDPTQATVLFHQAMQTSHALLEEGSPGNHMFFLIDLTIRVGERTYSDLRLQASQPYGTHFGEAFEVYPIKGYTGPLLNRDQLVQMCEDYYRRWIGPTGMVKSNSGLVMHDNLLKCPMERTIDLLTPSSGAW